MIETVRGREYKLFVNTRPPYRTGAIRSDVMLRTNIESQMEIFVSAYAIVPADFEMTPPTIPIPPILQDGEAASLPSIQILNFSNYGKKPIRVTGATCSDSTVNASVFEVIAGKQYRVTVELPPRYRAGGTDHFVTLITDDEAHRAIEIPIGQQAAQARHAQAAAPAATQPTQTAAGAKKKFPALELIGKAAPPIALTTLDGAPVGNPEFEFHPATVLNFFAANCPYCKRQIPKVEALRAKYESLGVRFVNVCETMRTPFTPDQVRGVMADLSANLEIAMDAGNRYGRSYHVTGFPVLFVVKPDGTIDHAVSGDKANLVQMIEEKLDALISEGAVAKSPAEDGPTSRPAS
ncbi:MAG: TlpA family protein disulfide reductase [Planctomycetes bacterium]|nr:TlpA family protein disulfide reductase [Planctomycetota bacterium]